MADKPSIKLNLSDESLIALLNFILTMVSEDRKNALDLYDTLAGMVTGPGGFDELATNGILISDISNGLTSFLKNSAQSTDQAIKVANIMANHLVKMDKNSVLTEEDREEIEKTIMGFVDEKKIISDVKFGGE